MNEKEAIVALNSIYGFGPKIILNLLSKFENAVDIFNATKKDLLSVDGLGEFHYNKLKQGYNKEFIYGQFSKAEKNEVDIVTIKESIYPKKLKDIYDPPPVLYVKGSLDLFRGLCVSIVGTRQPTIYGMNVTRELAIKLAESGIPVISGLAYGIDIQAHSATVGNEGVTGAVLGVGIDRIYKQRNKHLLDQITLNGAIISEFPMGAPPEQGHFPRRNRIISGMSDSVVIVEAGDKSGALITADYAIEHGKDVFAVPGNINSLKSRGTNKLIRDGAHILLSTDDLLFALGKKEEADKIIENIEMSKTEKKIFNLIQSQPIHVDKISLDLNIPVTKLHQHLFSLELKGVINQTSNARYVRV